MGSAGGYELVPVVKTPSIKPGERVRIDVYCTSAGVPSGTELRVDCDAALVPLEESGEGQVPNFWVATHGNAEGSTAGPRLERVATDGGAGIESADGDATDPETAPATPGGAGRVSQVVSLNPMRFDRTPTPDAAGYDRTYTVSETPKRFAPPAQVEILTGERCPAGEYEIPFTFSYPDGDGTTDVTETVTVQVGSFAQRLRTRAASSVALGTGLLGAAASFL